MRCYQHRGLDSDIVCVAGWLLSRIQIDVINSSAINTEECFFETSLKLFIKANKKVYPYYNKITARSFSDPVNINFVNYIS